MGIIWTIIIGFVAGLIARFIRPGASHEPSGFILTTLLGIVGAFVATFLGQAIGWYQAGEVAGLWLSRPVCPEKRFGPQRNKRRLNIAT
jgi:uncharacterized membrane protein YeaQ/YmgE (transglycosylase-associated protein family)